MLCGGDSACRGVIMNHSLTNNRLKLIKRMMFGKAEFPLLRQRVLHAL